MKISWDSVWLSDEFAADGQQSGLSFNGRQLVQEADFLRAASAAFFARRNRSVALSFTVARRFSSIEAAEVFVLGHYGDLSDGPATLLCRCDGTDVLIQNAVLENIAIPRYVGTSVLVTYHFRCPSITAVTGGLDSAEEASLSAAIPLGVSEHTVSGLALAVAPYRVVARVRMDPAGSRVLFPSLVDGTLTADGFSFSMNGNTETAGYILDFLYSLTDPDGMSRTFPIPNGVSEFSVSGQAFPAVPARVVAGVRQPSGGGRILVPTIVGGSLTTDGFDVVLNADTDSADYVLDFFYKL